MTDQRERGFRVGQELWQVTISGVHRVVVLKIDEDQIVVGWPPGSASITVHNGHFFVSRAEADADFKRVRAAEALRR